MARRGHNEGTICQRPDGRWTAALNLGYDEAGKRQRKYFYGKTRKEVADKLKAAQREHDAGLPVAVERQTVGQFLDRWLCDVAKPKVAPKTFASYSDIVRLHLKPTLGRHQLSKLTPQHVQALIQAKTDAGLSPRTVSYIRTVLRIALAQAVKWDMVARNVATLVDPPRAHRTEIRPLTPDQARAFLEAVTGDRLEGLYRVALAMGLRQGEALGLRWEDIDLDQRTLRIRVALQRIDGKLTLKEPKTEKSRRTLTMPTPLVRALTAHRDRQAFERAKAGDRWIETGLIFTTPIGTPLEPSNVTKRFQELLRRSGLPHQRFHDLRHCCASLLLAQNVPARVVMDILGHTQISTTLDLYSHVMPAAHQEAADLMGRILEGTGT